MDHKWIKAVLAAVLLILACSACGKQQVQEVQEAAPSPYADEETVATTPELEESIISEEEVKTDDSSEKPENEAYLIAMQYIDLPMDDLRRKIGEPISEEYVGSCLGNGYDGVLTYDGFTVYTYKEGDGETVRVVAED